MSGFWDRRRAAVAAEAEGEAQAVAAAVQAQEQAELEARDDAELLEELGLPSPDNLVDGAQLRAFLKAQLPQRLKTRALRGFWRSNPVLACLDGLNDYDDDYTLASTAGQTVNTLYQVGKGMVQPIADMLEEEAPQDEVILAQTTDVDVPEPQVTQIETAPAYVHEETEDDADVMASAPTHRRMRFHFAAAPDAESTGA
ncbi:Protein of unknown function [Pseudosulfitobacter pseudonitzschiae]|uniref:DUF3306 domain-containing protein n=1 Tax=Pseudosulfitobacter pseudonitzschiae TaxID=1402135 RepID=A0A073JBP0_9RHOB|nr:DUF3306 domain-containing protein [Pseudosulfitobacter pseudonitzschiae]KEJ95152.1 hypothetical protein SUH3_21750 [Pseudosulfitobacter pseudonitzschiae]QKS11405.1 DUF3306 domain-containing protein [Pseudosulfitobacter pseudonitzschiae]SHF89337.1 Protein of unknown function [Pseudosulfitobacter pseudonitzschiae]